MKTLFSVFLLLLIAVSSFAQFDDTAQLNQFFRDTIRDRRPDKVTAAQIQKGLLGLSSLFLKSLPAAPPAGGDEGNQYLTTLSDGSFYLKPVPSGGTPSGSGNEIQFKDGGSFGSNSTFVFSTYNNNNYVGIGTASPNAKLHVIGASPADVTTTNGTSADVGLQAVGGAGGNTSYSSGTATGGQGGNLLLFGGAGGVPTSATTLARGGVGGMIELAAGNGGSNSNSSSTTGQGGKGGALALFAGTGGIGRGTTARGGDGGDVTLVSGRGGNTAGTSRTGGNSGNVFIQTDMGFSGATQGGSSGYIEILSGLGANVNGSSGNVYLACGSAAGTGTQGNVFLGISHAGTVGGNVAIGTSSFVGSEKLRVNGNAVISGIATSNYINMNTTLTPSSSADTQGADGDVRYDSDYIYIKVGGSWKRSALSTF